MDMMLPLNTLKDWLINDKTIHTLHFNVSSLFRSLPTSFPKSSSQKRKVLRSILSEAVVVPTCRVRAGALDHRQQLLGRRPWCFLDLHSLENHGGRGVEFSMWDGTHHNRLVPLKKKIRQFQTTFSFQKYSGHKLETPRSSINKLFTSKYSQRVITHL